MFHFLAFSKTRVVEVWGFNCVNDQHNKWTGHHWRKHVCFCFFFLKNFPIVLKFSILHLLLSLQEMWKYFHTSMDQLEYCYW